MGIVPSVNTWETWPTALRACKRCALAKSRTQVVVGGGDPGARVMFTGEAPGRSEDKMGVGFQGAAGKWFDALLGALGIERSQIWLNNVVRCRPVAGMRNRRPRLEEIAACRPWLEHDISGVNPLVVVTLGKVALEALTGDGAAPRGVPLQKAGRWIFPLYHPAYLIYRKAALDDYILDLAVLGRLLDDLGIERRPRPSLLSREGSA